MSMMSEVYYFEFGELIPLLSDSMLSVIVGLCLSVFLDLPSNIFGQSPSSSRSDSSPSVFHSHQNLARMTSTLDFFLVVGHPNNGKRCGGKQT